MTDHLIKDNAGRDRLVQQIMRLPLDKEAFEVSVRKYRKERTNAQNRLYWVWMGWLADETGSDKDAMHDHFRKKFLGCETVMVFGKEVEKLKSTKEMKVPEFIDYLTRVEAACSEFGYVLPAPVYYQEAMDRTPWRTTGYTEKASAA